jgi:uncharacterized protein (TIGR02271 family)
MQIETVSAWRGRTVVGADDDKIGSVEEIYLDAETNEPEWLAVSTGLFGMNLSFVPIAQASERGDDVRVPYDKAKVKNAPRTEPDGQLSQTEESALYRHYGLDYGNERSDTGLPDAGGSPDTVGRDVSGPTTDDAMTRYEEEIRIGTTDRERGRVRLKKYVVEDEVTETVPVRREEVRVEREPITEANVGAATDGPAISDEEHEVVLHEEEPVVEKRAVPKERVRVDKDTVTDERQVTETARKEQIELEGDERRRS